MREANADFPRSPRLRLSWARCLAFSDQLSRSGGRHESDHALDLIDVIPATREKSEEATAEDDGLEIAELRELFPRDPFNHCSGVDLLILDHLRDGGGRDVALDTLAIEILLQPTFGSTH